MELYFSRDRFTVERDQTNVLYFLNGDVKRAVIDQERKATSSRTTFESQAIRLSMSRSRMYVLDDLRQSPYPARIEFEKVFTDLARPYRSETRTLDGDGHVRFSRKRQEQRRGSIRCFDASYAA